MDILGLFVGRNMEKNVKINNVVEKWEDVNINTKSGVVSTLNAAGITC